MWNKVLDIIGSKNCVVHWLFRSMLFAFSIRPTWKLFHELHDRCILWTKPVPVPRLNEGDKNDEEDEVDEKIVFIEYRGKVSDSFESSLKKLKVPCKIIFTSKKPKMDIKSETSSWKVFEKLCGSWNLLVTMSIVLCRSNDPTSNHPT